MSCNPLNLLTSCGAAIAMIAGLLVYLSSSPTTVGGETTSTAPTSAPAPVDPATDTPSVVPPPAGCLYICGGGILPPVVLEKFVELAGGAAARIVYIPTASMYAGTPDLEARLGFWREQQATGKLQSFEVVHAADRDEANQPDKFAPLRDATGVWFGGGVQSRLTERYLGTAFEQAVQHVLKRGGTVGGTSAGAAIMSDVMIQGGSPDPVIGPGFGFLKNSVVDQHFIKRNRHTRLANALQRHPQRVGIGIDEGTALIVSGDRVEVVGDSKVVVCVNDAKQPAFQEIASGQNAQMTQVVAKARVAQRQYLAKQAPVARPAPVEKVAADMSRSSDMPQTGR